MEKEEATLLTYQEVLESIENQECHLLLGNGFNRSLCVNTSYESIFQEMIENRHGLYREAKAIAKDCNYDLERFIGRLEDDINADNQFLRKYIRNKVKFDFMKATHKIVKSEIKNVYAEKNEGVILLLKNFTNYFTLNFDLFLYLLLLNFKSNDGTEESIAFQQSIEFVEEDLNKKQDNIYAEINRARREGILEINIGGDSSTERSLSKSTKTRFTAIIKEYSSANDKGWKDKDVRNVVDKIFDEEKRIKVLNNIDDGYRQKTLFGNRESIYLNKKTQNLFFLHGAFHIYREGKRIKKITQQSDKALYDRLENILNDEEQEIVCVFQSENKINAINESDYLRNCFNKLASLSGKMVIIGSSLADNDNHIFEQINNSDIDTIYISTLLSEKEKVLDEAKNKFPSKTLYLFDAKSISYELPESLEE
ncbi:MAG TPA: DUF4917 family protein [Balneolaceae bacterium]